MNNNPMTTVCTIYWNAEQHAKHVIISEVAKDGSHKVVSSHIYDCMLSAAWTLSNAQEQFGAANVRMYMVEEFKG
jgi:hypothetical protein